MNNITSEWFRADAENRERERERREEGRKLVNEINQKLADQILEQMGQTDAATAGGATASAESVKNQRLKSPEGDIPDVTGTWEGRRVSEDAPAWSDSAAIGGPGFIRIFFTEQRGRHVVGLDWKGIPCLGAIITYDDTSTPKKYRLSIKCSAADINYKDLQEYDGLIGADTRSVAGGYHTDYQLKGGQILSNGNFNLKWTGPIIPSQLPAIVGNP